MGEGQFPQGTSHDLAVEILREHKLLHAIIRGLQKRLEGGTAASPITVVQTLRGELREFRDHLQRHFDLEEQGGFLDDIVVRLPTAARKIELLRREHETILASVDELLDFCTVEMTQLNNLCMRVHEMISNLKRHENVEHELIQAAYCLDIGTGD